MYLSKICFVALLVVGSTANAAIILTDIEHTSTGGGVWNDNNVANWGIWVASGSDPSTTVVGDFLNPGNPIGNTNIVIPNGISSYIFFKENCCGGGSVSDKLHFNVGTIDLGNSAGLYHLVNDAPNLNGATINAGGDTTLTVVSFSWYEAGVFSRDFVGSGQSFGPSGNFDQIALVTLQVLTPPAPEPSSLCLLGLGAVALAQVNRRRRAMA